MKWMESAYEGDSAVGNQFNHVLFDPHLCFILKMNI